MKPYPFGKYYLLDLIATGGMAEIFLAKDIGFSGFERFVAIKRILPHVSTDEEFVKMFIDEARLAAKLAHANIVHIYDFGCQDKHYYLAMEYVRGRDLRAIIKAAKSLKRPLPLPYAVYIGSEVCKGLHYAHTLFEETGKPLGIIHRDISPQNILISFQGEVKVVDFGIAKAAGRAGETQAGVLKGKFGYMSPEQASGNEAIDHRSDIYSVGIVLFEALTGERLFDAPDGLSTLRKVQEGKIPKPSEIKAEMPLEIEKILLKALTKNVKERYQTAGNMSADLNRFLNSNFPEFTSAELGSYLKELFTDELARDEKRMKELQSDLAELKLSEKNRELELDIEWNNGNEQPAGARPSTGSQPKPVATVVTSPSALINGRRGKSVSQISYPQPPPVSGSYPAVPQSANRWAIIIGIAGLIAIGMTLGIIFMRPSQEFATPNVSAVAKQTKAAPEPQTGALVIVTDPPEAIAFVDGEKQTEPTPITLKNLPIGKEIEIVLEKEGYKKAIKKITIASPDIQTEKIILESALGILSVSSEPAKATLYIDDNEICETPCDAERLATGKPLQVTVAKSGFEPFKTEVTLGEGEKQSLTAQLTKAKVKYGFLTLNSVPWAQVAINGKPTGKNTPLVDYKLPAGKQKVTLTNPAMGISKTIYVNIPVGKTEKKTVKLKE